MLRSLLFLLLTATLTGCLYKMPSDDHIATSPHTNNPLLTREKAPTLFPGKS